MRTIIVTRHSGALDWIKKHHPNFSDVEVVSHANPDDLVGVRVIGVLPIPLAALCEEYYHLSMQIPQDMRGKELTCGDMERFGCKIERYLIVGPRDFCHECESVDDWTHDEEHCAQCFAPRWLR